MLTILDVDLETIELHELGKLARGEIDECTPKNEMRVYKDAYGYEQRLPVDRITRDGAPTSWKFTVHLDDGAAIIMDVYPDHPAVTVKFAHRPF